MGFTPLGFLVVTNTSMKLVTETIRDGIIKSNKKV